MEGLLRVTGAAGTACLHAAGRVARVIGIVLASLQDLASVVPAWFVLESVVLVLVAQDRREGLVQKVAIPKAGIQAGDVVDIQKVDIIGDNLDVEIDFLRPGISRPFYSHG